MVKENFDIVLKSKYGELLKSCRNNDIARVQELLEKGCNVNEISDSGKTALYLAASCDNLDIVKLLVKRGAEVNFADSKGFTALEIAVSRNNPEVVKFLFQYGARIDSKQVFDKLMGYCSANREHEIKSILLDQKAKEVFRNEEQEREGRRQIEIERQKLLELAREFWTVKLTDEAAVLVQGGDTARLREFFDSAFYKSQKVELNSGHLKLAVAREDIAMIRLLVNYGAKFSPQELAVMQIASADKYPQYLKMLRNCGLKTSAGKNSPSPKIK